MGRQVRPERLKTELSWAAQHELALIRLAAPYSLGWVFPDTPGAASPDDGGRAVPLEEWVANAGVA